MERINRTIKDSVIHYEFRNLAHARAVIHEIVRYSNEERHTKISQSRYRKREINLKIKQHSLAFIEQENIQNHNLFQRTKITLLS